MKNIITAVVILIVLAIATFIIMATGPFGSAGIANSDLGEYQAVFLVNGQLYFGKVEDPHQDFIYLTDIYYLQLGAGSGSARLGAEQAIGTDGSNLQLIKLGNELHGPTDQMWINKEEVLIIENLKADSNVVKAISEFKKTE